jgi:SET domain-containing protein
MEVRSTTSGGEDRGKGLFATVKFKKGDKIGEYGGERIDSEELMKRCARDGPLASAEYVVQLSKDEYLDDRDKVCMLAYSNDAVDLDKMRRLVRRDGFSVRKAYKEATDRQARNSELNLISRYCEGHRKRRSAVLYATRDIEPGEEIRWSYGCDYWKERL